MIRNISIGIDLGSATTKIVVGEFQKGEKNPKIIGMGESPTKGIRHGYVVNFEDAVKSVRQAILGAEKTSGIKVRRAFVSIGGISIRGEVGAGMAVVSKADGEVTTLDTNKALEDAEANMNLSNKKVMHVFPIAYKLDGKEVTGRLEGMRGTKLEVKALFVTCSNQHIEDLLEVITEAGIDPIDCIASGVAGSYIALTEKQKVVGGAVVNIGAETVSLAVFENNCLMSLHTFSIGAEDITNDIALGLKIPLEKAEHLKLGNLTEEFPKKKLDEIVHARLGDIFELIENHLKKIKRSELLPAGVVFIGGGANTAGLEDLSRSELRLPSMIGNTDMFGINKTKLRDPAYFTVLGLLMTGKIDNRSPQGGLAGAIKDFFNSIKLGIKQLLP